MRELLSEFCNDVAEVHAFVMGVYDGLLETHGLNEVTKQNADVKKEMHYAKAGYVIGFLIKAIAIGYIGSAIL